MIATAHWSPEQWVTVITGAVSALTAGVVAVIHELRYQRSK